MIPWPCQEMKMQPLGNLLGGGLVWTDVYLQGNSYFYSRSLSSSPRQWCPWERVTAPERNEKGPMSSKKKSKDFAQHSSSLIQGKFESWDWGQHFPGKTFPCMAEPGILGNGQPPPPPGKERTEEKPSSFLQPQHADKSLQFKKPRARIIFLS